MSVNSSDKNETNAGATNTPVVSISASRQTENNETAVTEQAEHKARSKVETKSFNIFLLNYASAFRVFGEFLLTLETVFACLLTVGMTLYAYYVSAKDPTWKGSNNMVWLLGFAVVDPMSKNISLSFTRREHALRSIEMVRSKAYEIYNAHACWDWGSSSDPGGGRSLSDKDWLEHADGALLILLRIGNELDRLLTLPSFSRARHKLTSSGRNEASRTRAVAYRLHDSIFTLRVAKLTLLTEDLKKHGLPPNESIRIRQWERLMGEYIEDLRMLKTYRTSQSLRSFARLFSIFLPAFYAPYFAQVAKDNNSLGLGIMFAIVTCLGFTALFESINVLEDPFVAHLTLNGIDVRQELVVLYRNELLRARDIHFPGAHPFQEDA